MKRQATLFVTLLVCALLTLSSFSGSVAARELSEGFVLTADNLDENLQNTFQGRTIDDLLTDVYEMRIREQNLRMRLVKRSNYEIAEEWKEKTRRYKGSVSYDPGARQIQNYKAGLPFPNVSADDPHAGMKVYFNAYLGQTSPPMADHRQFYQTQVDGNGGIERTRIATAQWYNFYNQYRKPPGEEVHEPDEQIYQRVLNFLLQPQDVRGIGVFSIQYMSTRLPTTWAYVQSLRRTRRIPSGNWGQRGQLGEFFADGAILIFHPAMYKKIEYLGKQTLLFPQQLPTDRSPINPDASQDRNKYKFLDVETPPHWNFDPDYLGYEPRPVHKIKLVMPDEHDLGSRVVYIDSEIWRKVGQDAYDKSGHLAQQVEAAFRNRGDQGRLGPLLINIAAYNFKSNRASTLSNLKSFVSTPGIRPEDISLKQLRRAQPATP